MRDLRLLVACVALIAAPISAAQAEPSDGGQKNLPSPTDDAKHVEPGKVGPGSENNSHVSPTSPDIPVHKQPPPDITLPADPNVSGNARDAGRIAPPPPDQAR